MRGGVLIGGGVAAFALLSVLFTTLLRPVMDRDPAVATPVREVEAAPVVAPAPATPDISPRPAEVPPTVEERPVVAAASPPPAPYRPDFTGPRVAILMSEVGTSAPAARAAIAALPAAVGLAFSPYPDASLALSRAARDDGHEVWVSVPMQPKSWPRVNPGPNTLLVAGAADENRRRLDWSLARVDGAVGVTTMMGSAFTESAAALAPVMQALAPRGLAFVDARSSTRSVAPAEARRQGVRAAANDRFLDESGSIDGNLAALEAMARRDGSAIGFARALPGSVAAIAAWSATLEDKGLLLVPPGSVAHTDP